MREFVLLPIYVVCGVIAAAALIVAFSGLLVLLIVVEVLSGGEELLIRLGLRQVPPVPEDIRGLESWWQEELDCFLAAEEKKPRG
jgi:hypothetical protein